MKRLPGLNRGRAILILLATVAGWSVPRAAEAPPAEQAPARDEAAVRGTITTYHRGFEKKDAVAVREALGDSFMMFNGSYSDDPSRWQAHMYLQGEDLEEWPSSMIAEAGPFANRFSFEHVDVRGNAALAVTRETGRNRFRLWENQRVTWLLGRHAGRWVIVGMFVRDERNPETME